MGTGLVASAWGNSWGGAWGNSWGSRATPPVVHLGNLGAGGHEVRAYWERLQKLANSKPADDLDRGEVRRLLEEAFEDIREAAPVAASEIEAPKTRGGIDWRAVANDHATLARIAAEITAIAAEIDMQEDEEIIMLALAVY